MLDALVKRYRSLPPKTKMLILGGGFSGQHVAKLARSLGAEVICSRRNINTPGAEIAFDSSSTLLPSTHSLRGTTHLLSCIPPSKDGTDPVLNKLKNQISQMPLEWVGYLSTTGVYGDYKGEWVSEKSHPKPMQLRSKRRLQCEKAWEDLGLPIQILRLPGIYGPGRSAIESVKTGRARMIHKPKQVFSRIHIDDIAGATIHLINLARTGQRPLIINVADDLPIANTEVLSYAAKLLKIPLPRTEEFDLISNELSPMALSFWEENRKVSNKMLCEELGYRLIHSNYQSGLDDCLKEMA